MRDNKSSFLLGLSFTLVCLSLILFAFWGYRFFTEKMRSTNVADMPDASKIKRANAINVKDSLEKIYLGTVKKYQSQLDSAGNITDSISGNIKEKLNEIDQLKSDINIILKEKITTAQMELAKEKIDLLQIKIEQLQSHNSVIERENRHLNALLKKYMNNGGVADNPTKKPGALNVDNKVKTAIVINGLKLAALNENNEIEESPEAFKVQKMTGSLMVKVSGNQEKNIEIIVVVIKPDGHIFQNSPWETGSFDTPDGSRLYTHKFTFENVNGDVKNFSFSLTAEVFEKGNYGVQIYYKGVIIGRLVKYLA